MFGIKQKHRQRQSCLEWFKFKSILEMVRNFPRQSTVSLQRNSTNKVPNSLNKFLNTYNENVFII